MRYFLFLDESGNHGLTKDAHSNEVFTLCGVLIAENAYVKRNASMDAIKSKFWNNTGVILHSSDIRKCTKEFAVLLDHTVKGQFYEDLNACVGGANCIVVAAAIRKDLFIRNFGRLSHDPYDWALSFIIERAVFALDAKPEPKRSLHIFIERRGRKEDIRLQEHFQRVCARGTGYVTPDTLDGYDVTVSFRWKWQNVNGLQLADLMAYPITRYVREPNKPNPAFDVFKDKFYGDVSSTRYGLKIYPEK